ncbi:cyclic nucleotide-binding domain-containing protein [Mycobacterium lepromatosis]|uniref:cyclic nucleotide-binding domain-containing protein n=1 Tax=Mycobacterium lepromatosis TaxID=480418 RepID=UPI0006797180|nr:cyclic nucleotide-binding domain-containing protein [Mycobacterium lepromatosis]
MQFPLAKLQDRAEQVELEVDAYLFHQVGIPDCLHVLRHSRLQVVQNDVIVQELGRGEVVGERGLLIDTPRSASIRAVRDYTLMRLGDGGKNRRLERVRSASQDDDHPAASGTTTGGAVFVCTGSGRRGCK